MIDVIKNKINTFFIQDFFQSVNIVKINVLQSSAIFCSPGQYQEDNIFLFD